MFLPFRKCLACTRPFLWNTKARPEGEIECPRCERKRKKSNEDLSHNEIERRFQAQKQVIRLRRLQEQREA